MRMSSGLVFSIISMQFRLLLLFFFFLHDTAPIEIYTLSYTTLFRSYVASGRSAKLSRTCRSLAWAAFVPASMRSEEHTSELQSLTNLVCRLLLEKKKRPNRECAVRMRWGQPSSHSAYEESRPHTARI